MLLAGKILEEFEVESEVRQGWIYPTIIFEWHFPYNLENVEDFKGQ